MIGLTRVKAPAALAAQELDRPLCLAAGVLLAWGLVMVASASVAVAAKLTGDPMYFFWRQLLFAAAGFGIGALVFAVPLRVWEKSSFGLLSLAFFLLLIVLIPHVGQEVNGARRWLDLKLFKLQVSEPARLALILYLAGYIVRRQAELQQSLKGLLKPLAPLALACLLLLLEPDYGAAAILFGVALLMLFLGGARIGYLALLSFSAVGGFVLLAATQAYRLRRLMSFQDPWADLENSGWQLAQSLIAIGRGEWTGVGLGNSVQKLLYLPEQHTDFIYAILAEEFGLIGTMALMALYAVVIWRGFAIGRQAETLHAPFRAFLAYGLTGWLAMQALINLAVNMGLVPTKGLTLPLISYGGSSLITVYALLALILRADRENRRELSEQPTAARWPANASVRRS